MLKNEENPYQFTVSTFLVTLKVRPLGLLYMAALLGPWACLHNTILTLPGSQNCVNSHNVHENCLKLTKSILFDCFNLCGHFKGPATEIIIHSSPPWTMGMLVQYHTLLARFSKLRKFKQYT